ncbi:MAG: VWA domain-containing protein [Candidatus Omnitrophica bacterium]|nr:VWA domain-containing protein [Candidatus Omnitrophota bacterium]
MDTIMKFANLQFNYFFLALAGLAVVYYFAAKKKKALLSNFANAHLLKSIAVSFSQKKENTRVMLLLLALLLMIIALLRPQWGFVWQDVQQRGADIFVAVDVSKSMLTRDVLPSRLERVKLAIEDLTSQLQGDRIGLIAFSGSAFVQCPLTIDYNGFLLTANDLNAGIIPRPGTNIASAINQAIESFSAGSEGTSRILIIITDGESHEGDAVGAAAKAAESKIKIHTIGVGTTEGELISIPDENGKTGFLKDDQGQVIKSRLNESILQEIALKSGGTYIKSTPMQFGLDFLYKNKIISTDQKELTTSREKKLLERFQIPLGLALLLLCWEPFISKRDE